jgi:alpha-N-acetylglucosamine transferase
MSSNTLTVSAIKVVPRYTDIKGNSVFIGYQYSDDTVTATKSSIEIRLNRGIILPTRYFDVKDDLLRNILPEELGVLELIPAAPMVRNDIKDTRGVISCWELSASGVENFAMYTKRDSIGYVRHGFSQYYTKYQNIWYIITVKYNEGLPEGVTVFKRGLRSKVIGTYRYEKLNNSVSLQEHPSQGLIILKNKPLDAPYQQLPSRYAYVSLLMKGDAYLPGLRALSASIHSSQTPYDFVCMITPDVTQSKVEGLVSKVFKIDYLQYESKSLRTKKQQDLYTKWFDVSYTKWNALKLIEYQKVILLDLDIVVLENLDHLFLRRAPAGTFSMPWAYPFTKTRDPSKAVYNPYINIKDNELIPQKDVEIGLNGYKRDKVGHRTGNGSKSSMEHSFVLIATTVLLQPSLEDFKQYQAMMTQQTSNKAFGFPNCNSMFDEQSIALFYKERWTMITQKYNMIPWHLKTWLPPGQTPSVYHFFGEKKPWEMNAKEWPDLKVWWNYYNLASEL